jgi:phosphatidylglycerophosphate synthase
VPGTGVVGWDDYAARWAELHGGFDPRRAAPIVRGWLMLGYRVSRPLAANAVRPNTVTVAGLLVSLGVPALAWAGFSWLAVVLVLVAALADSVDGALAVVGAAASRLGFVLDSVVDRLIEVCWLAGFWLLGAPGWLVVLAGGLSWLHEYLRARAAVAGMSSVGVVTISERPTRVIVAAFGLLLAGLHPWAAPMAVGVWCILGLIGLVQLTVAVRAALR